MNGRVTAAGGSHEVAVGREHKFEEDKVHRQSILIRQE